MKFGIFEFEFDKIFKIITKGLLSLSLIFCIGYVSSTCTMMGGGALLHLILKFAARKKLEDKEDSNVQYGRLMESQSTFKFRNRVFSRGNLLGLIEISLLCGCALISTMIWNLKLFLLIENDFSKNLLKVLRN